MKVPSPPAAPSWTFRPLPDRLSLRRKWLLAESWCAEAFTPPPFTKLAFRLLTYVPWLALDYMMRVVRRVFRESNTGSFMALVGIPPLLLIGPIIGLVLAMLILVLLLLHSVPLAVTRAIVPEGGDRLDQVDR